MLHIHEANDDEHCDGDNGKIWYNFDNLTNFFNINDDWNQRWEWLENTERWAG